MGEGEGNRRVQLGHVLRALEVPALLVVPAAMLACAYLGLDATGILVLLASALSVGLFLASYEASRPALRQVVPAATLGGVAAAGRIVFAPIPDVKPVSAIAIVAGATLGRQGGFMVGAIAALVSNFFFGQGAWTPMQMYAWGLVGYLSGVLADHGAFRTAESRPPVEGEARPRVRLGLPLCAWGFSSGLLYGLILNGWYVLGYVRPLAWGPVLAAYAAGLPLDVTHGIATVAFLALVWIPWGRSIRRVVAKYGL